MFLVFLKHLRIAAHFVVDSVFFIFNAKGTINAQLLQHSNHSASEIMFVLVKSMGTWQRPHPRPQEAKISRAATPTKAPKTQPEWQSYESKPESP